MALIADPLLSLPPHPNLLHVSFVTLWPLAQDLLDPLFCDYLPRSLRECIFAAGARRPGFRLPTRLFDRKVSAPQELAISYLQPPFFCIRLAFAQGVFFPCAPRSAALHPILAQHTCNDKNCISMDSACPQPLCCTMPLATRIAATRARGSIERCCFAPFPVFFSSTSDSFQPGPVREPSLHCHVLPCVFL